MNHRVIMREVLHNELVEHLLSHFQSMNMQEEVVLRCGTRETE